MLGVNVFSKNYTKIELSSQRKELLLFLATNIAAVTSRAYPHNIKQSMRNSKNLVSRS